MTPPENAACGHTAHRVNDQGRQGQINGTAWEPCGPGSAAGRKPPIPAVRVSACDVTERCAKCGRVASFTVQTGRDKRQTACPEHVAHLLGEVFYAR